MQKTLLHPFGLAFVIVSLVLAGLMLFVLDRWSGQALWIVLLGLLAYTASVVVLRRSRSTPDQAGGSEDTGPDPTEDQDVGLDSRRLRGIVQEALQKLDNLGALSQCELVPLLPGALAPSRIQEIGSGAPGALAPLEKAQALREVLIAAIERLKPAGGPIGAHGPETLQYDILHLAYVECRPVVYILARFSISEANYHVRRRAAIDAVGSHILAQEELIGGGGAGSAETG
jgi:hypothetical protein